MATKTSSTFTAYPIVDLAEPDYETWAREWCERKGWTFVERASQRQCSSRHVQLTVRIAKAVA